MQLGYKNVYRDAKGFPEWKAAGLPVQSIPVDQASIRLGAGRCWSAVRLGDALDIVGGLCRWAGSQPDAVCVSFDSYNGLLFWRQIRSRSWKAGGPRSPVPRRIVGDKLSAGSGGGSYGSLMGAALQNPIVLMIVAGVLVFFATSLFGFWELQLPQSLTNAASKSYAGYFGTLFMGLTLGVVAAPCLGPFVLGLLTWVASMGSPWLGFLIFFTLSLGLGVPLFFLAMFSGSLEKLPGSGEWMLWVRKLMGWVLVGMAAYFVKPLLPSSVGVFVLAGSGSCSRVAPRVDRCHSRWFQRIRRGEKASSG